MIRLYALALGVLAADVASKALALDRLRFGESVEVLPFLDLTLACNAGSAFGLVAGHGWVFASVAVLVSVYLAFAIWRVAGQPGPNRRLAQAAEGAAYALVLGGALGNLADRLLRGCVVDFVHVNYGWFNFPVFNVADSAITVGAVGWIWALLVQGREAAEPPDRP